MLKKLLLMMTVAGVALLGFGGAAFASGTSTSDPSAAFPGGIVVGYGGGNDAIVPVAYRCTTKVTPLNHLFVAVKEGPNVSPQNPSSDPTTTAFLSTNWNSDSGPNALNCDGRRHIQLIVVKPQGFGPLKSGRALVQICVYDNVTGFTPEGEPIGGFAPSYTMQSVFVIPAFGH